MLLVISNRDIRWIGVNLPQKSKSSILLLQKPLIEKPSTTLNAEKQSTLQKILLQAKSF